MKVLGLICMAVGSTIFFLSGLVWWPGVGEEWPGIVPLAVVLAAWGLILLGVHLWKGSSGDQQDESSTT